MAMTTEANSCLVFFLVDLVCSIDPVDSHIHVSLGVASRHCLGRAGHIIVGPNRLRFLSQLHILDTC